MIAALKQAFDGDIDHCLTETNEILIEAYDCYDCIPSQQRSYIKNNEDQPVHFVLHNPNIESLVFAALDNCILKSHHQSRCDFIVGNFLKLYFVEVKQVNKGQRRQARTNATQQLRSSIEMIKDKIDLTNTELLAVICLRAKQVHPLQSAKRVADIVAFKEAYNVELTEGQQHVF